jgi:hypothetical protein
MSTDLRRILANPNRAPAGAALMTAAWARYLCALNRPEQADAIERSDETVRRILTTPVMRPTIDKADQTIGTTTGSHWADDLVASTVGEFFASVAPFGAGAKLIAAGERVAMGAFDSVAFPFADCQPGAAPWIAEGDPISVKNFAFDQAQLGPAKKLGVIIPFSKELVKRSAGRRIFDRILREYAAHAIDLAIFNSSAGTSAAHAGIFYGATAVATSGDIKADVATLLTSIADNGAGGNAAIVGAPREIMQIKTRLPQLTIPCWATRAMAAGTVGAIDVDAFASSVSDVELFASEESVIHLSDTPLEITSATGPAYADPVASAYQVNAIFLRVLVDMAFVMRNGAVALAESVSW